MREERTHEVNDEEMSEGSAIARVKGVCSQQTIQRMMTWSSTQHGVKGKQTETERLKEKKEQCQPQAGSNCRQCDRSKATGTVLHKEPKQQRFKKNVKVRTEAQKVKTGEEVSGPCKE